VLSGSVMLPALAISLTTASDLSRRAKRANLLGSLPGAPSIAAPIQLALDGVPVVSATTLNCQPHQRFRITQTRCPEAPLKR